MGKGGKKQTTTTTVTQRPRFEAELAPLFAAEFGLLSGLTLPAQIQRLQDLGQFVAGNQPANILTPTTQAVRTAAALGGGGAAGPTAIDFDATLQQVLNSLRGRAPEVLGQSVTSLLSPQIAQFAQLMQQESQQQTRGGGPSAFETGMQVATTGAIIAGAIL